KKTIKFIFIVNKGFYFPVSLCRCYSYIGRQGGQQPLSLKRNGCVYHQIVQHEFIHALGFNHEWSHLEPHLGPCGMEYNFNRVNTNNLGTPYDYGSVMHYGRRRDTFRS
ncbi:high choriolytic enzyme 1-like, partial [Polyodon spathula]|uniref:high choriolytic enzyme 1-like n=1 Tax=Polyodon spathula TaxID=7913 RepID=UPI001B7ED743